MTLFWVMFGIYIGSAILPLLDLYIDFRKNCYEKGKAYTLEDLCDIIGKECLIICFIPVINSILTIYQLIMIITNSLWNKIKTIKII